MNQGTSTARAMEVHHDTPLRLQDRQPHTIEFGSFEVKVDTFYAIVEADKATFFQKTSTIFTKMDLELRQVIFDLYPSPKCCLPTSSGKNLNLRFKRHSHRIALCPNPEPSEILKEQLAGM